MNIKDCKTVLLTGSRDPVALDLARSFYFYGVRVIAVDSLRKTVCTYSRCVDRYVVVRSPVDNLWGFTKDLQRVIENEGVDLVIPMCEEALYVSKIQEKFPCAVFSSPFTLVESLHNKWKFFQMTKKESPRTELLREKSLPAPYIVKPVYSRFAAHVEVVCEEKNIEDDLKNPKIVQEFIEGEHYCSYAVVYKGKVRASSVYKVLHSIGMGAAFSMESVVDKEIETFVSQFVDKQEYTGQISFDFIRNSKALYVLECNPRATSGVHLFDCSPNLAKAFFEPGYTRAPKGKIYHETLTMVWYGMKQKELWKKRFWKHFYQGKNVLIRAFDLGPLFFFPMILLELLRLTLFKRKALHVALSQDLEYNGEVS